MSFLKEHDIKNIMECLSRQVSYVGIDVDFGNIYRLIRAYFLLKKWYGKVEVYYSPSKTGFHIRVPVSVSVLEDILARAVAGDDEFRLVHSLRKIAMSKGEEKWVDLLFKVKNGKEEERIDMEGILEKYKNDVLMLESAIELGDTKKINDALTKLVDDLEKELRPKSVYAGCIAFNEESLAEELKNVCNDIMLKDPSFKYRIWKSVVPGWEYILTVYTDDEDCAWKKITWLANKTILKDKKKNMWVKKLF
ncbi:MAG: hypothetical protein QW253_00050 [Metallosphaera sp.]